MALSSKLKEIREELEHIRNAQASINARVASAQETENNKALAEIMDRLPTSDVILLGQIARRQKKRLLEAGDGADLELLPDDKESIEGIAQRCAERWNSKTDPPA